MGIVIDILKGRIVFLRNELKQEDAVINFLSKKLTEESCQVVIKSINANILFVANNDSDGKNLALFTQNIV